MGLTTTSTVPPGTGPSLHGFPGICVPRFRDQPVPPGTKPISIEKGHTTPLTSMGLQPPGYAPGSSGRRADDQQMRNQVAESVVGQGNKASQTTSFAPFHSRSRGRPNYAQTSLGAGHRR